MSLSIALACCLLGASPGVDAAADVPKPERIASNLIFVEPLGNGLLYSINYERLIGRIGMRVGASYFTWAVSKYGASGNLMLMSAPIVGSYYVPIARSSHNVELGLGATLLWSKASTDSTGTSYSGERTGFDVAATAVLGYRYLPKDGGVTFGAGFTPLVRTTKFLPWGGLSAGYVF